MSSFRCRHEVTSVQRLMLQYLRIPHACFRTANMLLWVQNMGSRPRFQWHTETKEPSPILHMSLGHASLSVNGNPSNSITGSIRLTAVVLRTPLYMMPPFRKTPNSPSERSVKKHINQRSRTNPFILWDPLLSPRSIDTAACPVSFLATQNAVQISSMAEMTATMRTAPNVPMNAGIMRKASLVPPPRDEEDFCLRGDSGE